MTTAHPNIISRGRRSLRVGFAALTDAAPLIAARELDLYRRHGIEVELRREIGWATVRDKIVFGELDAAQAPAPLLWAAQLGLGGPQRDVLTGLVLNLHGNAITLSSRLHAAGVRNPATFRTEALRRHGAARLTLGVVHLYSFHHLQLRQWLLSAGLNPDKDVCIVVVPPAQMFRNLVAGIIDGYCAGEPWGSVAVRSGQGWCPTWSARLTPGHVEKVLMVRQSFADERSDEHLALIAALHEACIWCDVPENRPQLVEWLAQPHYVDVAPEALRPALLGRFEDGLGRTELVSDFHIFSHGEANIPTAAAALSLQSELISTGLLAVGPGLTQLPSQLFREDLYRAALSRPSHTNHEKPSPHSGLKPIEPCLA